MAASLTEAEGGESLESLIQATAQGDREAFRNLYLRSSGQLFGVILRIVRRRDRAEDVLQEVYLRIWNHAPDYRPEKGSPLAWMATIARNRALDWARRHPDPISLDAEDDPDALGALAAARLDWSDTSLQAQALKSCLDALPQEQRDSILLAHVQGYTHDEISSALGSPLGTVKSWIRRGLLRLKSCLDQ